VAPASRTHVAPRNPMERLGFSPFMHLYGCQRTLTPSKAHGFSPLYHASHHRHVEVLDSVPCCSEH